MKLRIHPLKIAITFAIVALVAAIMIFGACILIFLDWPWDWRQPTIIALWFVSSIVFLYISLTQNYYTIENKCIVHHRFKKELYYYFKDIVYIDHNYAKKHKVIQFVTQRGDIRYITFDSKGLIYETMCKKCKNLLDYETLKENYPNLRSIKKPK